MPVFLAFSMEVRTTLSKKYYIMNSDAVPKFFPVAHLDVHVDDFILGGAERRDEQLLLTQ